MSYRMNKKKYGILLLVFVLAIMGVGYAYLSTTVNFNGNALINNASWNIYLDNIQVTDGSVLGLRAYSNDNGGGSLYDEFGYCSVNEYGTACCN